MKIVLLRHCTTSWNREKRLQGKTDIPLDAGGFEEGLALAKKMVSIGINRIICSNLQRAVQTASIVGEHLEIPVQIDFRLAECGFGALEGNTKPEAQQKYGDSILVHLADDWKSYDFSTFGGETQQAVLQRHVSLIEELKLVEKGITLLVGHGRGLNTLLGSLGEPVGLKRNEWRTIEL